MTTIRDRKRFDQIKTLLTPRELMALFIADAMNCDSLVEYNAWIETDLYGEPCRGMLRHLENSIFKTQTERLSDSCNKLHRSRASELTFLYYLFVEVNRRANDFCHQQDLHGAVASLQLQNLPNTLFSISAIQAFLIALVKSPYPVAPEFATVASAAIRNHVTVLDGIVSAISDQQKRDPAIMERVPSVSELIQEAIGTLYDRKLVRRG